MPSWALITIIVAVTLVVGAGLLVAWKVIVYIRDRREWEEFQKDKEDANWASVSVDSGFQAREFPPTVQSCSLANADFGPMALPL